LGNENEAHKMDTNNWDMLSPVIAGIYGVEFPAGKRLDEDAAPTPELTPKVFRSYLASVLQSSLG
jgi:hypothetical protein